ncbi:MAG: type I phosphomannose isomerase catalytic subunit [Christensenellales bacterium]
MPVFKLTPVCKSYVWGGARLITEFGKRCERLPLAETWELSCHREGQSTIAQGVHVGCTLADWLVSVEWDALGYNCAGDFPILIKLIDAAQALSVQVHPDDDYAAAHEGQSGKTEAWYIVDCDANSYIYLGFTRTLDTEEFVRRTGDGTLAEVMEKIPVKKGNVFFVPPGTVHAIGPGLLIAEIQQSSNVTYRVYDHGRVDIDGTARELHIAQACDVARLEPARTDYDFKGHLVDCPYFTVDKLRVQGGGMYFAGADSFHSLLVLEGEGEIICGGDALHFCRGDSLFVPACSGEYVVSGRCEALLTTIGSKARAHTAGAIDEDAYEGGRAADGLYGGVRRMDWQFGF